MTLVRVLPDDLVNQIAAGEVVERPASVVKELVENAIDAGAKRLTIEIEAGGLGLVRVADDGCGMARADAELSVLRHATSKIVELDDLRRLSTFGFRGEALPSIASVSRFVLQTRRHDADEGTEIRIEGGGPAELRPCGCAPGTAIEVRELFFNVPARRKFLRAASTEAAHVTEVAQAAAFAEPGVTVVLKRDGRVVREWLRASSREDRTRGAFEGEELAGCRGQRGPLSVEAFLSRPERARSGAGGLSLFVNGRPVRDRALARAVAQAYGSVLEAGRYPIGAVYLELPHELVDVNVHPQKAEVRFADGRAVADALYHVVAESIARAFGLPTGGPRWRGESAKLFDERPTPAIGAWAWQNAPLSPGADGALAAAPDGFAPARAWDGKPPDVLVAADPWGLAPRAVELAAGSPVEPSAPPQARAVPFQSLRFLVQVRATFLVCEGPDGLYLLDQHAAAERVTFERLRRARAAREVARQALLFPVLVSVAPSDVALVEEAQDAIAQVGLDVRPAGTSEVAVHAVPALVARAAPERLVRDLLAELGRSGERAFSAAIDRAIATMACHGSLRAGDPIAPEEAAALLAALDDVDFAGHCPHGRPIVMRIGWAELEHRVGRR